MHGWPGQLGRYDKFALYSMCIHAYMVCMFVCQALEMYITIMPAANRMRKCVTKLMLTSRQCWASYFVKVTSYILHITCN